MENYCNRTRKMIQLLRKIKVPVTLAKPTGASCAHLKKNGSKHSVLRVWDLSNKNASMIHHGKWLISSDLNHRRCDNSMTVTRHKGGCVFVQRWNMPSTLKDATYRCIPLQMGENILKKKHQHKTSLLGFLRFFWTKKKTLSLEIFHSQRSSGAFRTAQARSSLHARRLQVQEAQEASAVKIQTAQRAHSARRELARRKAKRDGL